MTSAPPVAHWRHIVYNNMNNTVCDLVVATSQFGLACVAIERSDNPGRSITNAAEFVWESVTKLLGTPLFTAIECYPHTPHTFDRVDLFRHPGRDRIVDVDWTRLEVKTVQSLLGEAGYALLLGTLMHGGDGHA